MRLKIKKIDSGVAQIQITHRQLDDETLKEIADKFNVRDINDDSLLDECRRRGLIKGTMPKKALGPVHNEIKEVPQIMEINTGQEIY